MSQPDYLLYHHDISPFGQRVVIQMDAKGILYTQHYPGAARQTDAFDAISPLRKLPVLKTADLYIPESEVICEYLEQVHPTPSLLPDDPAAVARMRLLARIGDLYVMSALLPLMGQLDPAKRDPAFFAAQLAALEKGLDWLATYIRPGPYAVIDRLTLADCALAPILFYVGLFAPKFGRDGLLADRPALASYFQAVQTNPHVGKAVSTILAAFKARGMA